jgi:tRNA(Ile)-lysidine synthase
MPLEITWPSPGRYLLAVSGGADSMVLLDLLAAAAHERSYELIVGHFDHGIRADSAADAAFVHAAAARYGLPFELGSAHLAGANEATARAARHAWLEQTRAHHQAAATLTAHHQDDLLETSLLNLARGSGRRGLAPMPEARRGGSDHATILRPLIGLTRDQLRAYAASHHVTWREDSTNTDLANPRNLLRLQLLAHAEPTWRNHYLALIAELAALNRSIDQTLAAALISARQPNGDYAFPKAQFRTLKPSVAQELIAAAARAARPGLQLDATLLESAATLARTGQTGKQRPLRGGLILIISRSHVSLLTKALV